MTIGAQSGAEGAASPVSDPILLLQFHREFIDAKLDEFLPRERDSDPARQIVTAMRRACAGGKRLRSVLAAGAGEMLGCRRDALAGLCACVEFLHSASIILDDLPSMDDAVWRRGQPPLHRQFDEATAVLAADALLMLAIEVLVSKSPGAKSDVLIQLVADAARTVGHGGMIGGQFADLTRLRKRNPSRKLIEFVHEQKTGRLFEFGARGAALLAGADDAAVSACTRYARSLGVAFQLTDDLLAATKTREELGKESRNDTGKQILATPFDRAWAQGAIDRLADGAMAAIASFGERAVVLNTIAEVVRARVR